jgi:succinyl-CoA synthetase beta subunit
MNLHEYQGKQLFKEYGLPVSEGYAAETPQAAVEAADRIGGTEWVVKCQVHAGGRGKAGGVKLVKDKATLERSLKPGLVKTWSRIKQMKRVSRSVRFLLKHALISLKNCISAQ